MERFRESHELDPGTRRGRRGGGDRGLDAHAHRLQVGAWQGSETELDRATVGDDVDGDAALDPGDVQRHERTVGKELGVDRALALEFAPQLRQSVDHGSGGLDGVLAELGRAAVGGAAGERHAELEVTFVQAERRERGRLADQAGARQRLLHG